jgi:dTDP-glucose 4,6-dehydratase
MRSKKIFVEDLDFILLNTSFFWDELRNSKIFITGGTGFFGSWLLETFVYANEFLKLNSRAVVLTRNSQKFSKKMPHIANHSSIELIEGDVVNFEYPEGRFSHIFHAATETNAQINNVEPFKMFNTIVEGTMHVLEFSKYSNANKLLYISSGAVYGAQPSDILNVQETFLGAPDNLDPKCLYGESKRMAELLCATWAKNNSIEIKIARCFAFVGPHLPLDLHFAIGNFIQNAINNTSILINGDGTPYRSYMYPTDLIIWLLTIFSKGMSCHPYNVGSDIPVSILETAKSVAKQCQPELEVIVKRNADKNSPISRYVPSIRRAKDELGLKIKVNLQDAIAKTICWYSSKSFND